METTPTKKFLHFLTSTKVYAPTMAILIIASVFTIYSSLSGSSQIVKLNTNKQEITIQGTVPEGTEKIMVNGSILASYIPDDREWEYSASIIDKSLKEDLNEYNIVAIDKYGNESNPTLIEVTYNSGFSDEKIEKTLPKELGIELINVDGIQVTSIEKISDDTFYIKGNVPTKTGSITVNNDQLQDYQARSTMWKHLINTHRGNLKEGKNKYLVTALDNYGDIFAAISISLIYSDGEVKIEGKEELQEPGELAKDSNGEQGSESYINPEASTFNLFDKILISHPSEDIFIIRGQIFPSTHSIMINKKYIDYIDHVLGVWEYVIYKEDDNLQSGTNTFKVDYIDQEGGLLHTENIELEVP